MIHKNNLEQLVLQNWTTVLDFRQIIHVVKGILTEKYNKPIDGSIKNLSATRFEWMGKYFILWLDYIYENDKFTSEFKIDAEIQHQTTVKILTDCPSSSVVESSQSHLVSS